MKVKNPIWYVVAFVVTSFATVYLYHNKGESQFYESLYILGMFVMMYLSSALFYELGRKRNTIQYDLGYQAGVGDYKRKYTEEIKEETQIALNARDSHWMHALETAKEDAVAITPELDHVYGFARQAVKHYQSPGNFTAPWISTVKKKPRRKKRNRHSTGGPF